MNNKITKNIKKRKFVHNNHTTENNHLYIIFLLLNNPESIFLSGYWHLVKKNWNAGGQQNIDREIFMILHSKPSLQESSFFILLVF